MAARRGDAVLLLSMKMTYRAVTRSRITSVLILAGSAAVLYFVRDVFIPVALALLLAFLLAPVTDTLRKLRLGRIMAALITLVLGFTVLGLLGSVLVRELMDVSTGLPFYEQSVHKKIQELSGIRAISSLNRVIEAVNRGLSTPNSNRADQTSQPQSTPARQPVPVVIVDRTGNGLAITRSFLAPLLGPLGQAGIVLLFTTFILLNKEDVRNRFVRLAGLNQISVTTLALDDAAHRVARYLRFALLINLCFGSLIALGLFLIGLPNVVLWGMLAGLMRFVPYVGILISGSAPLLLALAIFSGWLKPALVLLLFLVLEAIVANAIEPVVYGANTGTSPLGLLVAAIFWTVLWGPVGLVLSTPMTVCLVVLGRYVPQLSFLHVLLAEEPPLAEDAMLYQRLLA
ncbi:MAG TPA: AI-2E family transporter, partial [Bryobacteraceae bacterium]|nr:AI-2E family transporter [Bryobacteraceae bacterium]